jgi:cytochrome P450
MADADAATQPLPAHVDPASVIDYDAYFDRRFDEAGSLHGGINLLAEEVGRGIFWTPRNGGHWLVNDHALLFDAVRDPALFSSSSMMIPPQPDEPLLIPLFLDPPVHGAFRLPLMRALSPEAIRALEGDIRALAREMIEAALTGDGCDFVAAIAEPLPIGFFMALMGMPLDRLHEFRSWVLDMLSDDVERRKSCFAKVHALFDALIRERQAERRDDILSRLIDAEIDGRPASVEELQGYCLTLFSGGLDTITNSMAFAMHQLAANPTLQARLRAKPERIPDAVEEVLRRYAVAPANRIAMRDAEFGGVQIRKGDRVMFLIAAANLDPKIFPDPMRFDIDRENKAHITFNSGPHRCVGSHLARLEMRIFLEEWLARAPTVYPDPSARCVYRAGPTLAIQSLPIVWNGAANDA